MSWTQRGWMLAILFLLPLLGGMRTALAQQLEPRAYAPAPIGLNFIGVGGLYSFGGVVTDPSLPIDNVSAHVYAVSPYYARTFGLFGRLATASVPVPYGWAHVEGDVQDVSRGVDRSGLLDTPLRLGINLFGCPALTPQELAKRTRGTTIGASIIVIAPIGEYDGTKLINLGTNRWAYKPELGFTQPFLRDWILELYAGVWLYGTNDDFYGGHVRKQDPLASFQTHIVYNLNPRVWVAADFTYYDGGSTTVDGVSKNDRQKNTRGGVTLSIPCAKNQSLRFAWAQGVSTRVGSSFQTFGLTWQFRWF